jgi:hypothetical protein
MTAINIIKPVNHIPDIQKIRITLLVGFYAEDQLQSAH